MGVFGVVHKEVEVCLVFRKYWILERGGVSKVRYLILKYMVAYEDNIKGGNFGSWSKC